MVLVPKLPQGSFALPQKCIASNIKHPTLLIRRIAAIHVRSLRTSQKVVFSGQ